MQSVKHESVYGPTEYLQFASTDFGPTKIEELEDIHASSRLSQTKMCLFEKKVNSNPGHESSTIK